MRFGDVLLRCVFPTWSARSVRTGVGFRLMAARTSQIRESHFTCYLPQRVQTPPQARRLPQDTAARCNNPVRNALHSKRIKSSRATWLGSSFKAQVLVKVSPRRHLHARTHTRTHTHTAAKASPSPLMIHKAFIFRTTEFHKSPSPLTIKVIFCARCQKRAGAPSNKLFQERALVLI